MDESGIEQASAAFLKNDPYYPRPGREHPVDQDLWEHFRDRFLDTSKAILGEDNVLLDLPGTLMDKIEERGAQLERNKAEQECYDGF